MFDLLAKLGNEHLLTPVDCNAYTCQKLVSNSNHWHCHSHTSQCHHRRLNEALQPLHWHQQHQLHSILHQWCLQKAATLSTHGHRACGQIGCIIMLMNCDMPPVPRFAFMLSFQNSIKESFKMFLPLFCCQQDNKISWSLSRLHTWAHINSRSFCALKVWQHCSYFLRGLM
jgi:hypothetical protein